MRKLLAIPILLLLAGNGWGATVYVRTDGSNTSPYDTPAKGATAINTAINYINANADGSGSTIDIGAGTFSSSNDYIALLNANADNLVIQGAGRTSTVIATAVGASSHVLFIGDTQSNLTVNDLTLQVEAAAKFAVSKAADGGISTFTNVDFKSGAAHADRLFNNLGDETNLAACRFIQNYATGKNIFYAAGDSSGTIKNCQFYASGKAKAMGGVVLYGSGATNFYNNVVLDADTSGVVINTGTVVLSNNIIQGGVIAHLSYCINRLGGTVTANNNLLISSPYANGYFTTGTMTKSGNIETNADPHFTSYGRGGYLIPSIDDSGALGDGYVSMLETLLAARGWEGTFYTNINNIGAGSYADVRTLIANGTIEVASHGYTHSKLTYANALNFSQTGGTNCTVAFDNVTITLNCDGTTYDNTYDTTGKTVFNIISAMNVVQGWTVAKSTTGGQTASSISDGVLATSFADMGATAEPCDITFDRDGIGSGYLKDEIADAKDILEDNVVNGAGNVTDPQTGTTYVANSFGATYNAGDAITKAAVATLHQNYRYTATADSETSVQRLTDVDAYSLGTFSYSHVVGDGSEAQIRQNTRALAFSIIQNGLIAPFFAHNTTEFSEAQWGWFLDEISNFPQITVTSMQKAVAEIMAGWTDDGDGTYSKTFTTFTDFSLLSSSPAINAGVDVGLTTDYLGNPIVGLPDIGAYEYQVSSRRLLHPGVKLGGKVNIRQ